MSLPEVWATLARKVLSSVLVDHGAVFPVRDVLHANLHWFPPREARLWRAVIQCVDADTAPTVEAVTARLDGSVPPGYVQAVANDWNEEDNKRVVYHAEELKRLGMLHEVRALGRELSECVEPDAVDDVASYAEAMLSGLRAERSERDCSAASVSESAWRELEREKGVEIPTGLAWFDELAGGLWPGMDYWIVAAYKQGKCVHGDTLVLTSHAGLQPIRDVVGESDYGFTPKNVEVWGTNGWVTTSHVYKEKTAPIIEISAHSGFSLIGTDAHPVLVLDQCGDLKWRKLAEIKVGDWVAIKKPQVDTRNAYLPKPKVFPKCRYIPNKTPDTMDADLALFMGLIISDGTTASQTRTLFSNTEVELKRFVENYAKGLGLPVRRYANSRHINSKVFRQWLAEIGLTFAIAGGKEVPWSILESGLDVQAHFIGGYFSGDGSVYSASKTANTAIIEMATKSKKLAQQIQLILCRLGILSRIRSRDLAHFGTFYRVLISGSYVNKFFHAIPVLHPEKRERLFQYCKLEVSTRREADCIPFQAERLARIHLANMDTKVGKLVEGRKEGSSRGGLPLAGLTITRAAQIVEIAHGADVDKLRELLQYSYTDIVKIRHGVGVTYDLTIPDGHAFWSNGLISHNTTLMRNAVLAACDGGYPVGVFVAEGSRELFALDCIAMIATRLLLEWGGKLVDMRLSGLFLRRVWRYMKDKPVLTPPEHDAIGTARGIFEKYPLKVWDSRDGITDLGTMRHLVRRSKLEDGTLAFWLDYSQLFGKGTTLFERQSTTALAVQHIAQTEEVAMCALAQKNEDKINRPGGYSPGVKGGGDAPAAADFLIVPKIDHEEAGIFRVNLKLSRHTRPASGIHAIESASGLIVDRWTIRKKVLQGGGDVRRIVR